MIYTKIENKFTNYEVLQEVLEKNNVLQFNVGVEVGVRHGHMSKYLLEHNPKLKLNLVDPYLPYMDVTKFFTAEEQSDILNKARKTLKSFEDENRVYWIYTVSAQAPGLCSDPFVDFVFIDAAHTYESCYTDCLVWEQMVRKGGIICGHDYNMDGVKKAVTQFANGRTVFHIPPLADVWLMQL